MNQFIALLYGRIHSRLMNYYLLVEISFIKFKRGKFYTSSEDTYLSRATDLLPLGVSRITWSTP